MLEKPQEQRKPRSRGRLGMLSPGKPPDLEKQQVSETKILS